MESGVEWRGVSDQSAVASGVEMRVEWKWVECGWKAVWSGVLCGRWSGGLESREWSGKSLGSGVKRGVESEWKVEFRVQCRAELFWRPPVEVLGKAFMKGFKILKAAGLVLEAAWKGFTRELRRAKHKS